MTSEKPPKKKRHVFLVILLSILAAFSIAGIVIYKNFNRLLSEALIKSFNSLTISDVYELKFEELRVNLIEGSIHVENLVFQPRKTPLHNYPYINSWIQLSTERLNLIKVEIFTLLKEGKLELKEIAIVKPQIHIFLNGEKSVLFPYNDGSQTKKEKNKKGAIVGFKLDQFQLLGASFYGVNSKKENEFEIQDFSIKLQDLLLDQQTGKDVMSFNHVDLSFGKSHVNTNTTAIKRLTLNEYHVSIDSLEVQKSRDTLIYKFNDFNTGLSGLDIQTADSINHVSLGSLNISYKEKSIKLNKLVYKPNQSDAQIQKKFKYQKVNFSGSVGKIEINKINFDSLIYYKKIYIHEILLDSVSATIFKDKLKPLDKNRFPEYFGQQIPKIPIPLLIKSVKATHVTLYNTERKPDSTYAKVTLNRGNAQLENITNLSKTKPFVMKAGAFIDNKVHFSMTLHFSYLKPQFTFNGSFKKFDLTDLNHLIKAYTPAKVNKGYVDEISFSGLAEHTKGSGTMKFLYHDLLVDLELKQQAKWKSSAIALAANTALPSGNPISADSPPRVVTFHAERDMNKGFINIILKSVLTGVKETFVMSKENKKKHHDELMEKNIIWRKLHKKKTGTF